MRREIQVFPSIFSGDFGRLAEEAQRLEEAGADGIHVDIMDGHFVPNWTLGPRALGAIRRATKLFLDVHLMIYNPFDAIEAFVAEGADGITFHFEATEDIEDTLAFIRRCNKKAGLAFRPETSFSMIPQHLPHCDMVLLMTVRPGFGGQQFLSEVVEKIRLTRQFCARSHLGSEKTPFPIQVDGGIDPATAKTCIQAGATVLVSGSFLFSQPSLSQAIQELKAK